MRVHLVGLGRRVRRCGFPGSELYTHNPRCLLKSGVEVGTEMN